LKLLILEVRFVLVKGPKSHQKGLLLPDPVNKKAPSEAFPLIAKFGESVVTPEFGEKPWSEARFFQRDIPKATDDSDDEANNPQEQPKKRWRARKKEVRRQWVLQEQVEFLEYMMTKRQVASSSGTKREEGTENDEALSSMYEGLPEHNSSHFILLEKITLPDEQVNNNSRDPNNKQNNTIEVTVLPTPHATISFSQPRAIKAMTMSEAEQAIDDQRNKTSRFMMHDQQRIFQGQAPIHRSRTRLLGKLMAGIDGDNDEGIDVKTGKKKAGAGAAKRKRLLDGVNDEDDVMGDLSFQNRSSKGAAKARQELLNSFGDDTRVDAEGVLGGGNDNIFGQRGQKFGHFAAGQDGGDSNKKADTNAGSGKSSGNDGNAMADDFYKRDVQAEYEELDYDANEQFDDDDVDVGEKDVYIGDSNFGGSDEDEDDNFEEDALGERPTGAEGLASLAGFRLMLAKARGEITPEQLAELADKNKRQAEQDDEILAENDRKTEGGDSSSDHLAQIMEAAEKTRLEAESKMSSNSNEEGVVNGGNDKSNNKFKKKQNVVEVDENGQRLVTLEAVRHEIWLARGRIAMKRLMKIFDVKKKSSQDRQTKFKEAVRELCTIETDPIGGRMLVLKQHYTRRAN